MTSLLSAPVFTGRGPTRVALPLRRVAPVVVWGAPRTGAMRVSASSLPHDAKQRGRSHSAVSAKATGGPPGAGATNPSAAPPVELSGGGGNGSGASHTRDSTGLPSAANPLRLQTSRALAGE